MAELARAAKDKILKSLFEGAIVGLSIKGQEITDPGYKRQKLQLGHPVPARDGARAVLNSEDILFGPWAMRQSPVTGWIIFDGVEEILAKGNFTEEIDASVGNLLVIHPDKLGLGLR